MGYGRGTASVSRPRPKIVSPTLFLPRSTLALVFLPTQTGPHWTAATRIGVLWRCAQCAAAAITVK
jgi:hypothetical protein